MPDGHDADLLEEHTVLVTFRGNCCLVTCRTGQEARSLVFRKFGVANGGIRIYSLDEQALSDIRAQIDIKTHRYDEE
ncbi:MAG: hypothetical protein V3S55_15370 [Nitrospiraceae bacterium]